ncbi:hypothetical protein [Pseudarthrobacter sp. PvP090]|uniref:hypothetical protein n=1 Tax=Pseudarthrobacter sp. PvP090 TaxID=3156393 RepID=UPI0033922AE1
MNHEVNAGLERLQAVLGEAAGLLSGSALSGQGTTMIHSPMGQVEPLIFNLPEDAGRFASEADGAEPTLEAWGSPRRPGEIIPENGMAGAP